MPMLEGSHLTARAPSARAFASLSSESLAYGRSEEHTSELQSRLHLVCRLLLEKKNDSGIHGLRVMKGQHLGYSQWHEVTPDLVTQFADSTGDHQLIPLDPERATAGPISGPLDP